MSKEEIVQELKQKHQTFIDLILSLPEEKFTSAPEGKWSPGQQTDHLIRSVAPLGNLLKNTSFYLSFGKSEGKSRTYGEVVNEYLHALKLGGKASGAFLPQQVAFSEREEQKVKMQGVVNLLCQNLETYAENQLDEYLVPHPLLGKLTLREILYFTIYHFQHHQKSVLALELG